MQPREYQIEIAERAAAILSNRKIVYIAAEVRTGKTVMALLTAQKLGFKNVLFLTKKKAISSIEWDYHNFGFDFNLTVINDESLHLVTGKFDLLIHDEHHRVASFPKPGKTAKDLKHRFSRLPMIFLSGTPTPESYSQWYHQFWISDYSPFAKWTNFYKWAAEFVNVKQRHLGYATVNDYSDGKKDTIYRWIKPYVITFTQKQAGFTSAVSEMVLECEMQPVTNYLINKLRRDLILKSKEGKTVLADTGVKLMQKIHQLSSGTVKFEDETSKVIDTSKAEYIADKFKDYKIAIFYKFKAELEALKMILGNKLTTDLDEFNASEKWIALQMISGREGISLKAADYLVYYNIDFSAVSYWQSRDRLTTMERLNNEVFYIFGKGGIEYKIYKAVKDKKDYTLSLFKRDYGTASTD
jgi:hypothetical protein